MICPFCKVTTNTLDTARTHQCYTCFRVWNKTGADTFDSIFGKVSKDFPK